MGKGLIASASIQISAPVERVWAALTDPGLIKRYMFGAEVISDWKEGSSIIWKGSWEGKAYEDKGVIVKKVPPETLVLTHFSPLAGIPDRPENYHTLIYNLSAKGDRTLLHLTQDNNSTEESRDHSQENWTAMLRSLKSMLENE